MSAPADPPDHPPDRVRSVTRAHDVLHVLADSPRPLSVTEVAERAGIHRATVHRLLRTMQDSESVSERPPGRFTIGPLAIVLGQAYVDQLQVRRLALPYIVDLSNRFVAERPWIVALGVPLRDHALLVERIWHASAPLNNILDVGTRMPFDGSVNGRVMLASFAETDAVERIGDDRFAAVRERLGRIRGQGYCDFSSGEMRVGMSAAAAAILGTDGHAVASIAISGGSLDEELHPASSVTAELRSTADAVSSLIARQAM